jgi:hypothetical protein
MLMSAAVRLSGLSAGASVVFVGRRGQAAPE